MIVVSRNALYKHITINTNGKVEELTELFVTPSVVHVNKIVNYDKIHFSD